MHPASTISPFSRWLETNEGLVSLLAAASLAGSLPGGLRLSADPAGAVLVMGRLCAAGPETVLATIRDWAGGFCFSFVDTAGNNANLPPIAAEPAAVAAIMALGEYFARRGFPASLLDFAAGGRKYTPGFEPLLPCPVRLDPAALAAVAQAAARSSGASRTAPHALAPDRWLNGKPVYDLRVAPEALSQMIGMHGADPDDARTLLVQRQSLSGSDHFLIADGLARNGGWMTWTRLPAPGAISQDVWTDSTHIVELELPPPPEACAPPGMLLH